MKVPAAWITLSLTAGSAFAAAFIFARREAPQVTEQSRTVAVIVETAAERDARAAAAAAEKTHAGAPSAGVLNDVRLREALAMTDLAAAIRHIMKHEGEDHCADTRLVCLVEQLPAARLAELPAALAAHMGNDYIVRFVLSAWAERDAVAALAWVQATPALNAAGIRAFLTGWMRGDPEAALTWLDARPLSTSSDNLRTAAVEAMAEKNPATALEMMKARGWIANSPAALVKLMRNWGGADPQAALDGLRSVMKEMGAALTRTLPSDNGPVESPTGSYTALLSALLLGAYERNSNDAAGLLNSLTPEELSAGSHTIAQEVFARDPATVAALFTANPNPGTRALLLDLARVNPALAIQNLESVSDPALRCELLQKAATSYREEMRAEVPPGAQGIVSMALADIGDEKKRHEAAGRLVADNAASSPQWAASLWRNLPEIQQYKFGSAFFGRMAESDPVAAIAEFRQSPAEVQNGALKSLTYGLAQREPAEALQLVLEQAHRATQSECAATLFARWAQADSAAALAALEQHAAQLDLAAIAEKLPEAGRLKTVYLPAFGTDYHSVPAKPVADKIQQLLGNPSSNE